MNPEEAELVCLHADVIRSCFDRLDFLEGRPKVKARWGNESLDWILDQLARAQTPPSKETK